MDYRLLEAYFHQLDRSLFLENELKAYAACDNPLPIGHGQTISQPSLVLAMTYLLAPEKTSRVLEIGTGSGYQTALLAQFSGAVYTVERISELKAKAQKRLATLGYGNIFSRLGDGSEGWAEHAPYDRIMVTAAAGRLPDRLLSQLKPGGRMVAPIGPANAQQLQLVTKDAQGKIHCESMGEVRFVEMKGQYGWK
jgi:protein-L-isoaspartate(D-aspartate) O-methyltransferase